MFLSKGQKIGAFSSKGMQTTKGDWLYTLYTVLRKFAITYDDYIVFGV